MTDDPPNRSESPVDAVYRQVLAISGADPGVVEPTPAVACVLWRQRARKLEILLVRRAVELSFMPGTWVFPGGAVEADDASPLAALRREVLEEIGVSLPDDDAAYVRAGEFVTPEFSPIRFAAQYYLVETPDDAAPDHRVSEGELDDSCWITPAAALARYESATWLIPSPVRRMIESLVDGIDGAAARCERVAPLENASPRVWDLAPGIALTPLRTLTLPPATHTNCYLIGSGDVVVIDPGSPDSMENPVLEHSIATLAERGRKVREIWLTHHHLDHVSGAATLAERLGVPIAAHPATAERLSAHVRVDRMLQDGDVIELDGEPSRRLRAVFTPGHAPGHLCFVEQTTGFAAVGDMVAGVGTILIDPDEGDMAQYLDSLRLLRRLAPAVMLPAHGSAITAVAAKLDHYVSHRLWREQRVVEAVEAHGPGTPADFVPRAYDDVPKAVHGLAERSLRAHLHKLLADEIVAVDSGRWRLKKTAKLL